MVRKFNKELWLTASASPADFCRMLESTLLVNVNYPLFAICSFTWRPRPKGQCALLGILLIRRSGWQPQQGFPSQFLLAIYKPPIWLFLSLFGSLIRRLQPSLLDFVNTPLDDALLSIHFSLLCTCIISPCYLITIHNRKHGCLFIIL